MVATQGTIAQQPFSNISLSIMEGKITKKYLNSRMFKEKALPLHRFFGLVAQLVRATDS
jgi:biotin synthase-related radical SAM superfamily protein